MGYDGAYELCSTYEGEGGGYGGETAAVAVDWFESNRAYQNIW